MPSNRSSQGLVDSYVVISNDCYLLTKLSNYYHVCKYSFIKKLMTPKINVPFLNFLQKNTKTTHEARQLRESPFTFSNSSIVNIISMKNDFKTI